MATQHLIHSYPTSHPRLPNISSTATQHLIHGYPTYHPRLPKISYTTIQNLIDNNVVTHPSSATSTVKILSWNLDLNSATVSSISTPHIKSLYWLDLPWIVCVQCKTWRPRSETFKFIVQFNPDGAILRLISAFSLCFMYDNLQRNGKGNF
jgi:hypothetical protein